MRSTKPTRKLLKFATIAFSVTSLLLIPLSVSVLAACLEDPTAFWQLEESATPFVDAVGSLEATCSGIAPEVCPISAPAPDGAVGNALVFNGTDQGIKVAVTNPSNMVYDWQLEDSFSVSVWLKTASTTLPLANTMVAVGRYRDTTIDFRWFVAVDRDTGYARARLGDREGNGDTSGDELMGGTVNVADGNWHLVILTRDASTGKIYLYVDGALEDSKTVRYTDGFYHNVGDLTIGYSTGGSWPFNGTIDEVALYDTALTPEIVKSHYDNGIAGREYCADVAPTVLTEPEMEKAYVGYPYEGSFMASGNPEPTFTLGANPPTGLTITDTNTGEIDWLPLDSQFPSVDPEVTAQNSVGSDTDNVIIDLYDLCGDFQIAFWDLDETASPFVDSIGSFEAACAGSGSTICPTSSDTDAILGNSLLFAPASGTDGTGLDIQSDGSGTYWFDWGQTQSFSVAAWVKQTALDTGTQVAVGRARDATEMRWYLGIRNGNAVVQMADRDGVVDTDEAQLVDSRTPAQDLVDGNWHLLALVKDGTNNQIRLYVDGVLAASRTVVFNAGFSSNAQELNIGYLNRTSSKFHFDGLIDEVVFYDTALPATVFATHYQNGLIGKGYCNTAPTFATPDPNPVPTTATEEQLYTVDFNANDVDPDTLTFSLVESPTGMAIDGSGVVTWTPDDPIVSSVTYTVQVSDNAGGTNTQQYTVTVTAVNDAPVITSASGARTLTTEEDTAFELLLTDVTYTDADNTSGFSLSVASGSNYTVSGNTITPDSGFTGNLTVAVTVSDGSDSSAPFNLTVEVTEVGGNSSGGGGGGGGCFINSLTD